MDNDDHLPTEPDEVVTEIASILAGGCFSFPREPNSAIFILTQMRWKELESDLAIEFNVLSKVHFSHPAGADLRNDLVVRYLGASCEGYERLRLII